MIESQGIWRVIIANEETRLSSASLFFTYLNILIDILSQNCHCWAYLIFIKDKNRTTESKSRWLQVLNEQLTRDRIRRRKEKKLITKNLNNKVADIHKRPCGYMNSSPIVIVTCRLEFDQHRKFFNCRLDLWSLLYFSGPFHFLRWFLALLSQLGLRQQKGFFNV